MLPQIATLVCALGILGLFLLDRNRKSRISPTLWIPILWLAIGGSRTVSEWLGWTSTDQYQRYLEGSPVDRAVLIAFLLAGLLVLLARGRLTGVLLRANGPLLAFLLYAAVSILWSDYPLVAFKRWAKALGDLLMVLVVLTNADARGAIRRLLARAGFLLVPLSILLIKYYPEWGRGFSPWTGEGYSTGVTTSKNGLGIICLVFGLGSLWAFIGALRSEERPRAVGPLVAHGTILGMTLWLFEVANSATALGCFLVGSVLLVLTSGRRFTPRPVVMHVLVLCIVSLFVFALFFAPTVGLVQAMGRDSTLTGRTELWADLLGIAVHPWFGTGFESFWLGPRIETLWGKHWWRPNQAHNGYLEVFLNLGWMGVALLGLVITWGYGKIAATLHRDPELGKLRLVFFLVALLYNFTEAAFKAMHPVWIIFLLGVAAVPELPSGKPVFRSNEVPWAPSAGGERRY